MCANVVKLNLGRITFLITSTLLCLLLYSVLLSSDSSKVNHRGVFNVNPNKKSTGENLEKTTTEVSLKHLLAVSIEIAERGGAEVKNVRKLTDLKESSKGKTKEGANDPLTEGDMRSHRAMVYGLKKTYPYIKVISEEHDSSDINFDEVKTVVGENLEIEKVLNDADEMVPSDQITVWVDPLDATQEYTENLLQYVTTMVCVAVKGIPMIGVIHKPFENFTAWGWVGHGASPQLQVAKTFPEKWKTNPVIIVSRSHAGKVAAIATNAFVNATITPAGGAGFKSLEVVQGISSAYIHVTIIKKWDICAGNAILKTLGGQMTTLNGNLISYEASDDVINKGGLLATMFEHSLFLEKLKSVQRR
ncbi:inositol monophosphatase 3-like [Limulus polyphemus]|uniref:inositol-phosphate phosphatase n=1 Tax=Limulus polyphemus TaxID=6850 RepID=A0ABM1BSL7_LIMPO|nr:inositol monophosphatase 3-like [Limulus polyphemus]XP_013787872.1 inositol monophosphatase 3-like [Limulus polyphemus]XP_022256116.1 inositol monophosphatase 3-like [Limulus polyphemus]